MKNIFEIKTLREADSCFLPPASKNQHFKNSKLLIQKDLFFAATPATDSGWMQ
ncbi:hypothetical protein [Polaromonas glacialis]|uniref:hypothetical protein n=1 Tax=Polaromonas glacialis TaxID=866564 RepID=UPI000A8958AD|nr:hypothetical protein [Polaromonas glacialis]